MHVSGDASFILIPTANSFIKIVATSNQMKISWEWKNVVFDTVYPLGENFTSFLFLENGVAYLIKENGSMVENVPQLSMGVDIPYAKESPDHTLLGAFPEGELRFY